MTESSKESVFVCWIKNFIDTASWTNIKILYKHRRQTEENENVELLHFWKVECRWALKAERDKLLLELQHPSAPASVWPQLCCSVNSRYSSAAVQTVRKKKLICWSAPNDGADDGSIFQTLLNWMHLTKHGPTDYWLCDLPPSAAFCWFLKVQVWARVKVWTSPTLFSRVE